MDLCSTDLLGCKYQAQFYLESFNLDVLQEAHDNFVKTLKSLNDEALYKEFSEDVIERFQNCLKFKR